ncbi:MAG: hypothetical protein QHH04_03490 [Methanolinea sp.]|jgi:hypothetical protein|nr:hypothetical protein [Methanolinea sp.]
MSFAGNETFIGILEGYDSLQRNADALGDNRDALYLQNGDYLLDDNDFIIMYGITHRASGKALYTNIAGRGLMSGDEAERPRFDVPAGPEEPRTVHVHNGADL